MDKLASRTARSFGFEWSRFNDVFDQYEENFLSYVRPLTKGFFKGKWVLDAGCGAGRHSYFMAKYGADVTAFDLSTGAVQATIANTKGLPVQAKQADIYDLSVEWNGRFDATVCLGVLHHTHDPYSAFCKLCRTLKVGGTIAVWVYSTKDNWMARNIYEPMRRITTKIPHGILYWLSLAPALAVESANRLRLPLFSYYRRFPFRTKWNDAFDTLSAPKSSYHTLAEVRGWFELAGMKDASAHHRMLSGKAKGIIGVGTK